MIESRRGSFDISSVLRSPSSDVKEIVVGIGDLMVWQVVTSASKVYETQFKQECGRFLSALSHLEGNSAVTAHAECQISHALARSVGDFFGRALDGQTWFSQTPRVTALSICNFDD